MKKLGFGLMRLPVLDGKPSKIDIEAVKKMADHFISRGFTYFDTAYPYHEGNSENAMKVAVVERYPRDTFVLADKLPLWAIKKPEDKEVVFNQQLERCGVEYFDYYLLHSIKASMHSVLMDNDCFDFLRQLKSAGKAKNIGFSFHDTAEYLDKLLTEQKGLDFVQLQINYIDWENEIIQSRKCFEVARKHGLKIVVMEPVKGGVLAKLPDEAEQLFKKQSPGKSTASWAIRYAASFPDVFMVLSGMSNFDQLADNTSFMENFEPLSDSEQETIEQAAKIIKKAITVPCTACRYCVTECPKGIPISDYFALFNDKMQFNTWQPAMFYEQLIKKHSQANACITCKKCEKICPQKIEISNWMKEVSKIFDAAK